MTWERCRVSRSWAALKKLHFHQGLKETLMQVGTRPHYEKHWGEDWLAEPAFPYVPLESQQIRYATGSKHVPSAVLGLGERKAKNMNSSLCSPGAGHSKGSVQPSQGGRRWKEWVEGGFQVGGGNSWRQWECFIDPNLLSSGVEFNAD